MPIFFASLLRKVYTPHMVFSKNPVILFSRPIFIHAALVVTLALAVSCKTIYFSYSFEDFPQLEEARLNVNQPSRLLTEPTWPGNLYRPVFSLSLMLGYLGHGDQAMMFHITNIILYALVCLAALSLLKELLNEKTALYSALFFACLPIHTEVVASIAFRTEMLAALFVLIFLKIMLNPKIADFIRYPLAGILLSLALLSLESSFVAIPLLFLCYLHVGRTIKSWLSPIFLISLVSAAYLGLRLDVLGSIFGEIGPVSFKENPIFNLDPSLRIVLALALIGKYIALCLLPLELSVDYAHAKLASIYEISNIFNLSAEAGLYILITCSLVLTAILQRHEGSRIGALWFLTAFSLTANVFFPIGTIFAEKLAFLPSLGLCIIIAEVCQKPSNTKVRLAVLLLMLGVFSTRYYLELNKWENDTSLLNSEKTKSSKSAYFNQAYGFNLTKAGKYEQAKEYFNQAIRILPKNPEALYGLGKIEEMEGKEKSSRAYYKKALKAEPKHSPALNAMGRSYLRTKQYQAASLMFVAALDQNNQDLEAIRGMIEVSEKKGLSKQASKLRARLIELTAQ